MKNDSERRQIVGLRYFILYLYWVLFCYPYYRESQFCHLDTTLIPRAHDIPIEKYFRKLVTKNRILDLCNCCFILGYIYIIYLNI